MKYFRKIEGLQHLVLSLILALPGAAVAVGFGEMDVHSYLNQPFDASIELINADEARNLSVELAGPSRYTSLNVSPPGNLADFSASLQRVGGQPLVQVTSRTPITDLVVDLVVVLTVDGSRQVRHYPVLVDFAPQLSSSVSSQPTQPTRPDPARRPQQVPERAPERTVQAVSSGNQYGPVQRGQTLSGIVAQLSADQGINGYQMMQAIVALNPQAFVNGNMNMMKAGAVLELPAMAQFQAGATPRQVADRTAPAPTLPAPAQITREPEVNPAAGASRRAPTAADPRLELIGTPTSGQILNSLNQWLEDDDTELGLRATEARRDLSYAAAEIETYRKENTLLRDRVDELEERLTSLRRLVALKAAEEAGQPGGAGSPLEDANQPAASAPIPTVTVDTTADSQPVSPVAVESELAATVTAASNDDEEPGPRWWPWALAVLLLLGVTGVVLYRGQMEDRARAQRTADLVHRIQTAGGRTTGEL